MRAGGETLLQIATTFTYRSPRRHVAYGTFRMKRHHHEPARISDVSSLRGGFPKLRS